MTLQRLTVAEYHRLIEKGVLLEGEPIELIDGLLSRKDRSDAGGDGVSHSRQHALCILRFERLSARVDASGCDLRSQLPVTLSEYDEPEPDVAIVRGTPESYLEAHPTASDVLAIVEIAGRSLGFDRATKSRIYAASGVPVYGILNLSGRVIELYESPNRQERRYERMTLFRDGDTIRLPLDNGQSLEVSVAELLP